MENTSVCFKNKKDDVYPTERLMLSCLCGKPLRLAMVSAAQGVCNRSDSVSGHDPGRQEWAVRS